jgi:hypothetical protein
MRLCIRRRDGDRNRAVTGWRRFPSDDPFVSTTPLTGTEHRKLRSTDLDWPVYTVLHYTFRLSKGQDVNPEERCQIIALCLDVGQRYIPPREGMTWSAVLDHARKDMYAAREPAQTWIQLAEDHACIAAVLSGQGPMWIKYAAWALLIVGVILDHESGQSTNPPLVDWPVSPVPAEGRALRLSRRQLALLYAVRQVEGLARWAWSNVIQLPDQQLWPSIIGTLRGSREVRQLAPYAKASVESRYIRLAEEWLTNLADVAHYALSAAIIDPAWELSPTAQADLLVCYVLNAIEATSMRT